MPLMKCSSKGKSGWKYGNSGHCYTGPGAKKKAIKQGVAEDGPEGFKKEEASQAEIDEAIAEILTTGFDEDPIGSRYLDAVQAYVSKKQRDDMKSDDFGWPEEKKYPISNQKELDAAVKLIGRAPPDKQAGIKSNIKRIAKKKGLTLPASWK